MLKALQQALKHASSKGAGYRSDYDLNPDMKAMKTADSAGQPAAVLVPLVEREAGYSVLLTKRAAHLPTHAGQISFPGGKVEDQDKTLEETALREAFEEIMLSPDYVHIIGQLDHYETGTGFMVTPIVAVIDPQYTVKANPDEVDMIFEVPLDFLLDRDNHQKHSQIYKGVERYFFAIPYGDHYIWGATAAMLVNLVDVIQAADSN